MNIRKQFGGMTKISVIMPIYNTQRLLRPQIESVLSQDYADYELILVDDGSTDDSGNICDEFSKKDKRIIVVHKINEGVDEARNTGMSLAHGQYLYFIDSDDELLPGALQTLVDGMESHTDVDISIAGYVYSHEGKADPPFLPISFRMFSRNEIMDELMCPKFQGLGMPWTNLYKASIIKDNHLKFNKSIHTIDDRVFMVSYLSAMKGNAFHTTRPIYKYNLGIGVSFQIKDKYDKRNLSIFDGQCLIYDTVRRNGFSSKSIWWARHSMINSYDKKRKYFLKYNDSESVKYLDDKFFAIIPNRVYRLFKLREFVKDLLVKLRLKDK